MSDKQMVDYMPVLWKRNIVLRSLMGRLKRNKKNELTTELELQDCPIPFSLARNVFDTDFLQYDMDAIIAIKEDRVPAIRSLVGHIPPNLVYGTPGLMEHDVAKVAAFQQ